MTTKQTFWRTLAAVVAMLLTMPATVWADSTFGGGSGTESDPYIIQTAQHLRQLAADVNDGNAYDGVYFKMTSSFSCWIEPFTPIGGKYYTTGLGLDAQTGVRNFRGIFDGNGCSIEDLNINTTSDFYATGLFGELGPGGIVMNLTIGNDRGYTISSWGNCGTIAGSVMGKAYIINCHVKNRIIVSVDPDKATSTSRDFGGIAGENFGYIYSCTSKATITNADKDVVSRMGGIVGINGGMVSDCVSMATVIGNNQVGAIAGATDGGSFSDNYYRNDANIGAVDGQDVDGTARIGTISFPGWIDGTISSRSDYQESGINYYAAGKRILTQITTKENEGYIFESPTFTAGDVPLTAETMGGVEYHTFNMPAQDVVIDCLDECKRRDINFTDWVEINIPKQTYTGNALTPQITIIDKKDGAGTTLVEGIDYTVAYAEAAMIDVGYYNVTITGLGTFAGTATATFEIIAVREGDGTAESPYLIKTIAQMNEVAEGMQTTDYAGVHFRLESNLDYDGVVFNVIGARGKPFNGTFDADGHTLNNIVVRKETETGVAIFGEIGVEGTLKNLILGDGCKFTANGHTAMVSLNRGTIEGCYNYATFTAVTKIEDDFLGTGMKEIVGGDYVAAFASNNFGTISNCVNHGALNADHLVGGIAAEGDYGTIINCLNLGSITANGYSGGILGFQLDNNNTFVNNYYAGNCNVGGIRGTDVKGQAMRGYALTASSDVFIQLMPLDDEQGNFVGIAHEGTTYVGASETTRLLIGRVDGASEGDIVASSGTLTIINKEDESLFAPNRAPITTGEPQYYLFTMPEDGGDVVFSIAPSVPSGIDTIDCDKSVDYIWYTISGIRLPVKPTAPGIYINGQKKVVIR